MVSSILLVAISLAGVAGAARRHEATVKRQVSDLRGSYDFVIAGAGTSGLTVADRLSEALPGKTVLAIEYGVLEYAPGSFDPPSLWTTPGDRAGRWTFFSEPNPVMNNKTAFVTVGKTVGGSSATNGQFFDRGSRHDYDAWNEVADGGSKSGGVEWDWRGIFPYFKKSVTFTKPPTSSVQKYGYTWDLSAYGGSAPIHSSFPPFQWADQPLLATTWKEMGIKTPKECAGGNKEGACWVPTSQHPVTARRSHSGLGHYADVRRPNYDLLISHQVTRVLYPKGLKSGPPVVEVRSLADDRVFNVTVKAEVIISAGALHTPTILQRSGIGPASFLQTAGVPLVLDLPGVGSNLQDHSGPPVNWNYTKPGNFSPVPDDLLNPAYLAEATAQFNETPAQGPYTLALGNSAIYVSLPHASNKYKAISKKIRDVAVDGTAASYLPPSLSSEPSIITGYKAQLLALADLFSNPEAPTLETPWATGPGAWSFLLHPLSRGTVRLNLTDPLDQPILDYRAGTNPIDFDVHLAHVRFLRKLVDTPTMKKYGAVEIAPGPAVQSDTDLIEYVKESIILSFQHPCCTAPMMPKNKGGVVGTDLKVHGASGLRVVDLSVMPLLVASHTSSTAYAVGEKAADIIIKQWKGY